MTSVGVAASTSSSHRLQSFWISAGHSARAQASSRGRAAAYACLSRASCASRAWPSQRSASFEGEAAASAPLSPAPRQTTAATHRDRARRPLQALRLEALDPLDVTPWRIARDGPHTGGVSHAARRRVSGPSVARCGERSAARGLGNIDNDRLAERRVCRRARRTRAPRQIAGFAGAGGRASSMHRGRDSDSEHQQRGGQRQDAFRASLRRRRRRGDALEAFAFAGPSIELRPEEPEHAARELGAARARGRRAHRVTEDLGVREALRRILGKRAGQRSCERIGTSARMPRMSGAGVSRTLMAVAAALPFACRACPARISHSTAAHAY